MSEKTKSWKIGDQEFDPRYDFFFCPSHGLIVPRCFSDEWTTDEGCPCALWNEESCDEPLTPVYLDNLVPAANQEPQVQPDGGEREAPWRIIVCKVCGEQMHSYDHGYLHCACKGWGTDPTDDDFGIFDESRHEVVPVVRAALADHQPSEEGEARFTVAEIWDRIKTEERERGTASAAIGWWEARSKESATPELDKGAYALQQVLLATFPALSGQPSHKETGGE